MSDMIRLRILSGIQPPQTPLIEQLKADRKSAIAAYDQLIFAAEQNIQLDEGLFTTLKATLATLGHLTGAGAKKIADATKKIGSVVKEIYLDNKAKAELEKLIKSITEVIANFEEMEKDAATIIKRDPEVAKEMELFATLINKLLNTLQTRMAIAKSPGAESS